MEEFFSSFLQPIQIFFCSFSQSEVSTLLLGGSGPPTPGAHVLTGRDPNPAAYSLLSSGQCRLEEACAVGQPAFFSQRKDQSRQHGRQPPDGAGPGRGGGGVGNGQETARTVCACPLLVAVVPCYRTVPHVSWLARLCVLRVWSDDRTRQGHARKAR